jgi:hypothetical protein
MVRALLGVRTAATLVRTADRRRGSAVAVAILALALVPSGARAGAWTMHSPVAPAGASNSALTGTACVSTTFCMAIGIDDEGVDSSFVQLMPGAFSELWNGTAWVAQPLGQPPSGAASLTGVSCVSTTSCVAVGFVVGSGSAQKPLAETWNGTSWAVQPAATLPARGGLAGVSCMSPTSCVAVGYGFRRAGVAAPLVEIWNGHSWRAESTPKVGKFNIGSFRAVSCARPNDCTAVGSYLVHRLDDDMGTLAEHWDGVRWRLRGKLGAATQGALEGISCRSGVACIAVGAVGLDQGQPGIPIAQRWNGRKWVAMPVGVGGSGGQLESISCSSARACVAVGLQALAEFPRPGREVLPKRLQLSVESYDGRRWTPERVPQSTASFDEFENGRTLAAVVPSLSSVSCVAPGSCVAVGGRFSGRHTVPLAETTPG